MQSDLKMQFYELTPDLVLKGVDAAGFPTTGRYIQLNSYENRVFELFLENEEGLPERVIAKYYRPLRWSREAILEEHAFLGELSAHGIPAIAPLRQPNQSTISVIEGIYLAIFPKASGRMMEELFDEDLESIGRTLAQIHNVGAQSRPKHRLSLTAENFGWPALKLLETWIAPEVRERYLKAAREILDFLEDEMDESQFIRIHGDCHRGNILYRDHRDEPGEYFFVDFDDYLLGPPAQDLWMLISDLEAQDSSHDLEALLRGYEELRSFDASQKKLFTPLRALRIIHYAAWIARRWDDPNFPQLFPQFPTYTYWAEEVEALEKILWSL